MLCSNCSHARADHATGRCVHAEMHHDPATGAVIDRCRCKSFNYDKATALKPAVVEEDKAEPVDETPVEVIEEQEPEEAPLSRFRSGRRK